MTKSYSSRDEVVADLLADYNAYASKSYTASEFADLDLMSEIGKASNFLYDNLDKWGWLVDYIATVASDANKHAFEVFKNYTSQSGLNAENEYNIYRVAYEVSGFVGGIQYTKNKWYITADYSQESIGNGF